MSAPSYRPLTAADIPGAQRLRELAKWNQTDRDWQNLLRFDAAGCSACEMDNRIVGTATATRFEPRRGPGSVAWIGMVLVDPEYRRHGIGSTLLKNCISFLQAAGVETIKLDATPMGRPVYEKLGFIAEYELERWEGIAAAKPVLAVPNTTITPCSQADLDEIVRIDTPIFGSNRREILEAFWRDCSEVSAVARSCGNITGFALSRPGTNFHQIGPILAHSPQLAEALLCYSLGQLNGKAVIVDVLTANDWAAAIAQRCGLKHQRPFLRMALGTNCSPGNREKIFAIACPELG